MDKKGQKRKDREKKVRERKKRMYKKDLEQLRERKRLSRCIERETDMQVTLECEILLLSLSVGIDSHTLSEAKNYIGRLSELARRFESLARSLDELFSLAHGK